MDKTPEILLVLPGHRYTEDTIRWFGDVACGKLDAFGFRYNPGEQEQFIPVFTASQGQSKRSLVWLGPLVSKTFKRNAVSQIRQVRQAAGIDYEAPIDDFAMKLTPEDARQYAEQIKLALEHGEAVTPPQAQPENERVS